jgi:hemerythrin
MADETETHRAPYVISWRDGFKVNIPTTDAEHKHLFRLIAALNLQTVDQTVEELLDYVVVHFSNEQELMEASGYPAYGDHLKLHEEFGAQVAEFLASGDPWTEDRIRDLRRFLNKWLIGHIMTHDMRFGKWYEKQKANKGVINRVSQSPQSSQSPQAHKGFFARLFGG